MHQHVVAARVHFASLIAGHHPRWNTRSAQQEGHGTGIMTAETAAGIEQELVNAVPAQGRRAQGVMEGLVVEVTQQRPDQIGILRILPTQFRGKGPAAGVETLRQLQKHPPLQWVEPVGLQQAVRMRGGAIGNTLIQRSARLEHEIAVEQQALVVAVGTSQAEDPGLMTGTGDDLVAQGLTQGLPFCGGPATRGRTTPTVTIKLRQGQGAPVQGRLRRQRTVEGGAKGQLAGPGQVRHIPRSHAFGQTCACLSAGGVHCP